MNTVNLGDDAYSVGMVAVQLAGARYGMGKEKFTAKLERITAAEGAAWVFLIKEIAAKLIIAQKNNHRARLLSLSPGSDLQRLPYANVIKKMDKEGKSMLTKHAA